jgi:hypothetical protein
LILEDWMIRRVLLVLALSILSVSAFAEDSSRRDAVHFGDSIVVHEDETMRDTVCFFCSVEAEGNVRDVVVFFGSARVGGSANDVVVFGGNTELRANASIHDAVVMGGHLRVEQGTTIRGDRVVFPPAILLVPLLACALVVYLLVLLGRRMFGHPRRQVVYVAAPPAPPRP